MVTCCGKDGITPIPQDVRIKDKFIERYKLLLGDDYEEFMKYSLSYIRKCIRVNTLKISVEDLKKRLEENWVLEPIPWCKEGFFITYRHGKRFDIGNLVEHQLGMIYVQDAASMLPPIVLNPELGSSVLDLCSAPGSKTTQLAQYLNNTGVIVANDVDIKRLKPLGMNLQRCGVVNTITAFKANKQLANNSVFDHILVDAPCSGTGTIRRSLKILDMWSPGLVKRMASTQRKLIRQAFEMLKPGGTMVYSTCTLEPEEDEGIIDYLLQNYEDADILPIELDIKRSPAITSWNDREYDPRVKLCLRITPQDNDTEGFFVCKIKKSPGTK